MVWCIFELDIIKTSRPGKEQPCLQFNFSTQRPRFCVARLLEHYLDRTSSYRNGVLWNLFNPFKPPYRKVSSQTTSRWVKDSLSAAGIDINLFAAYSIKHAATSKAKLGLSRW